MSILNQPLPSPAAISTPQPPTRTDRLFGVWVEITASLACALAHRGEDREVLANLQIHVENTIVTEIPSGRAMLDELMGWEASLLHVGETAQSVCLICRRARSGSPDTTMWLPLPHSDLPQSRANGEHSTVPAASATVISAVGR